MANVNISNLVEKTTVNDSDVLLVEDSSSTNKVTKANLLKEVNEKLKTIPTKVSQLTNDSGYLKSVPAEYITETELDAKGYLTEHQDISGKVDKVSGKGLSTNDYTTAEKTKLTEIAENANNYKLPQATSDVLGGIKVSSDDANLQIVGGVLSCKKNIPNAFKLPKLIKVDALAGESELAIVITTFNNLIADLKAKGYMADA